MEVQVVRQSWNTALHASRQAGRQTPDSRGTGFTPATLRAP
jgi:hypothetical protein